MKNVTLPASTLGAILRLLKDAHLKDEASLTENGSTGGTYGWGNPELSDMICHLTYLLAAEETTSSDALSKDA